MILLVDDVGTSFMEIVYFPAPDKYEKDMQLISGNVDHADGLMLAVIKTAQEIKRTSNHERLETAPDEFSFIIKDSMSWFDRSVHLFNKMDNKGLVNATYTNVGTLERRLKGSPNLMDFKREQFTNMDAVHSGQQAANASVEKCILELDKLLDFADARLERLQSELAASVGFGYQDIIGTILVLIVLASFHFNTVRLMIKKKISDLAAINEIGRQLALVHSHGAAFEQALDTVYKRTGLNVCSVVLTIDSGELTVAGN